jgi:hypothetical protein
MLLLVALRVSEAEYYHLDRDVKEAVAKMKKQNKYSQPVPETNRLYKHPLNRLNKCDISCNISLGKDASCLVARDKRDNKADNPAIYYRLIASGN